MTETVKPSDHTSISQQDRTSQQTRIELASQVQAELTTLNVRYRDMQETMSRLITMLVTENAELKTENTTLKNQLSTIQTQNNTEIHTKQP